MLLFTEYRDEQVTTQEGTIRHSSAVDLLEVPSVGRTCDTSAAAVSTAEPTMRN